jgi:mannosylglycerate hydrolase
MAHRVNIVPHTHWDREWYKPYPLFRMQLVELLDGLLPELEADSGYAHFQLDGQMAVVDDYLEVRPAERERLVGLNRSGRLSMGPWYTLPDEFLVSGETLVRDLRLGLRRAADFGGAMQVGYLPDMFGHVAQMPQILAGFGFGDAVVWRGVPLAVQAPAFWWEAPDGTTVRAEFLSDGYSNGARLPDHGKDLVDQVDEFRAAQGPLVGDPVLWMNGTDHQLPQARLGRVVAEAAEAQDRYELVVTSLAEHLAGAPRDGLPTWKGEMRSGARANLLMGVASCRIDVKQAAARAERWLERVAEPLAACWLPAEGWPGAFLDLAWQDVVRNAAHDSICGCSADEVNDAVLHRYAESTRVAEAIADRALVRVLATSGQDAVVANPTARPRSGMVSAIVPGDVAPPHTQQLSVRPARQRTHTLTTAAAVQVVLRAGVEDPKASDVTLAEATDGSGDHIATVTVDRAHKRFDATALREQLEALAAERPDGWVHLEFSRPDATQEVLLRAAQVPGLGWRGLAPSDLADHAVRAEGQGLTNGLVTVVPDPSDGTFSLDGITGFGRLVDDGDAGDTYNWSPPSDDLVVERPDHVEVLVSEAGPVRGRIKIVRRYRWPTHVEDDRRCGSAPVEVTTLLELRAGEDLVRVSVSFDNQARDHRLRITFPLLERAAHSDAECAFGTVRRGLAAEGGPNEHGLPTFPSRRFVAAGGLLVAHDGLPEYELIDIEGDGDEARAGAIALTVLRSVGIISQGPMAMRALPAGPPTLTPAAQMLGPHHVDLVLHAAGRDPYAVADEAFTPLLTARFPGRGGLGDPEATGQALHVEGAEVTAVGRRADGRVEVRAVNASAEPSTLAVAGRAGEVTDLKADPTGEAFDGTRALRPWEIVTLALDDA